MREFSEKDLNVKGFVFVKFTKFFPGGKKALNDKKKNRRVKSLTRRRRRSENVIFFEKAEKF